jgi:hypothetical protein
MRRWFTLGGALIVAVALLLISGDTPTQVRGQTPANAPSAAPTAGAAGRTGSQATGRPPVASPTAASPVTASPDLESVRQQLTSFFSQMQSVANQATQSASPRTRAALATNAADASTALARAQQAVANATPQQLQNLQLVLAAAPNLDKLPGELSSALGNLGGASTGAASHPSALPKDGGSDLDINDAGNTYSTFEDPDGITGNVQTCEQHFNGLLVDPNSQHRFDARAVWIGDWVTQQVISALQALYNGFAASTYSVDDFLGFGVEANPAVFGLGIAIGVANAIQLGEQEELTVILDCVTNSYAENLYTEDAPTKVYQQLALEADVTQGRAAALAAGLSSGTCTALQELPASISVGSSSGQLDDVKWFVTNLIHQMKQNGIAIGNAETLQSDGDGAYAQQQWKTACQDYAKAFVELSKESYGPGQGRGNRPGGG